MREELEENSIGLFDVVSILWGARWKFAKLIGIVSIVAVVVSLLLPEYFRSSATILPETEKSKLSALGGLSDLAALAGVNVGGEGSIGKLYPTIIKSEAVLKNTIYALYQSKRFKEPVNLIKFWDIAESTREQEYERALKDLRNELAVSFDNKTNVVTIAIETREPGISADILNSITAELDSFIRTRRKTSAGEQREWIETRLDEINQDLRKSENNLKEFREKNRRLGDSPKLLLEQARLMREVDINSTIYIELTKQQEIAKIEEIKNVQIVNVLDSARPAARKERPRRLFIVLSTIMISLLALGGLEIARVCGSTRVRSIIGAADQTWGRFRSRFLRQGTSQTFS